MVWEQQLWGSNLFPIRQPPVPLIHHCPFPPPSSFLAKRAPAVAHIRWPRHGQVGACHCQGDGGKKEGHVAPRRSTGVPCALRRELLLAAMVTAIHCLEVAADDVSGLLQSPAFCGLAAAQEGHGKQWWHQLGLARAGRSSAAGSPASTPSFFILNVTISWVGCKGGCGSISPIHY